MLLDTLNVKLHLKKQSTDKTKERRQNASQEEHAGVVHRSEGAVDCGICVSGGGYESRRGHKQ